MRNFGKSYLGDGVFKFPFSKNVPESVSAVKCQVNSSVGLPDLNTAQVPVVQEIWKGVVEEQKKNELKMIPAQEAELELKTVISDASSENERLASPSSALPQSSSPSGSVDVKGFLSGCIGCCLMELLL